MSIVQFSQSNRPYWLQFVFAGQAFTIFDRFPLVTPGVPFNISFTTGNNVVHIISAAFNSKGGGPTIARLIEAPTITDGTPLAAINLNRLSSKVATTLFFRNSTALVGGTVIDNQFVPGAGNNTSTTSLSTLDFEIILKRNTKYVMSFDNLDTTDADFQVNLHFYESSN